MIEDYEGFSESQIKILSSFVTSTSSNIFVLRNLPEVLKGALFSRYSRSNLGLRSLLLKEFILNEETAFNAIVQSHPRDGEELEDQVVAIKKAQNFYDRILDGYGDDSIAELGGAHLALEHVSMLAAKLLEDCRIGGSPLEKSTRYIYFDQKVRGEYLFHREPILMTSAYRDLYVHTCNHLFNTYTSLIPQLTTVFEEKFPREPMASKGAYTAALRAKVLDCLRGLLPASTLTNMGIYGNGRFYEQMIHKLHSNSLAELQDIGMKSFEELSKVIPSFISRSERTHKHHIGYNSYYEASQREIKCAIQEHEPKVPSEEKQRLVSLINLDPEAPVKVAAALLFAGSHKSLDQWQRYCKSLSESELASILEVGCSARENRRHKSPRALEHAQFTFEMVADFGIYRDLHRHRMLTQERELLDCNYGYWVPHEIKGTEMETLYCQAMDLAKETFDIIATEFPEEAQYVVPMGYNVRWYFTINLRALQWLCELRSSPAGHPSYRYVAQEMATQVSQAFPLFKRFFKFVDFEGYELGRMGQEERRLQKKGMN